MQILILLVLLNCCLSQTATNDTCTGKSYYECQLEGCCYTKVKIFNETEVETCADPTLQTPASTRELVCTELADRANSSTWIEVDTCKCGNPNTKEEAITFGIYGTSGICIFITLICLWNCIKSKCRAYNKVLRVKPEPLHAYKESGSERSSQTGANSMFGFLQGNTKQKGNKILLGVKGKNNIIIDGSTFQRKFVTTKATKRGKISFKNGDSYLGSVLTIGSKQLRDGKGIMKYKNKDVYDGQWKQSKRHGQGTQTYVNLKTQFKGTWANGQQIKGRLNNKNPASTDSKIDYNKRLNLKKYWFAYNGEFKKSLYHGKGTLTLCNGDEYEGTFQNGQIKKLVAGKLKITSPSKKTFTGTWNEIQKKYKKFME